MRLLNSASRIAARSATEGGVALETPSRSSVASLIPKFARTNPMALARSRRESRGCTPSRQSTSASSDIANPPHRRHVTQCHPPFSSTCAMGSRHSGHVEEWLAIDEFHLGRLVNRRAKTRLSLDSCATGRLRMDAKGTRRRLGEVCEVAARRATGSLRRWAPPRWRRESPPNDRMERSIGGRPTHKLTDNRRGAGRPKCGGTSLALSSSVRVVQRQLALLELANANIVLVLTKRRIDFVLSEGQPPKTHRHNAQ